MANRCAECGQLMRTGYRRVTDVQARRMAKAAGITTDRELQRCDFRDGMAEHAAKLRISMVLKWRAKYGQRQAGA